jgi:hypothetical protein
VSDFVRTVTFGMRPGRGRAVSNYAHVRKTVRHGFVFDSRKEADRYDQLLLLERNGELRNLRRQVRYEMRVNGALICRYTADFVYEECRKEIWTEITEDVKGYPNERWPMKKKLFKAIFGREIRET